MVSFVRHIFIAGIPANEMETMRPFNEVHYDFSLARTSNMVDESLSDILKKEDLEVASELKAAKFACLVFDGTTHLGEASFFAVRYWKGESIAVKCIAAKHANKSMDAKTLCKLFKAVCDPFSLKYSSALGEGPF